MGILDRFREWWDSLPADRGVIFYSARCDASGITQTVSSLYANEVRIAWSQVSQVCAYKRDCFAFDQIRVALWSEDSGVGIEVTEEDAGFEELIDALPLYLPGCLSRDKWFERVAFPAFALNLTSLYRRMDPAG